MSQRSQRPVVVSTNEVAQAKDAALRQLGHLRRELEYDYPPSRIREARRAADQAVVTYTQAQEAALREMRRGVRR